MRIRVIILVFMILVPQLAYGNSIKWLPANVTVSSSGSSSRCKIAADGDFVVIVWEDIRNDYTKRDIYCNFSTDGGLTWQATDRRLNTNAAGSSISMYPHVAVSGSRAYVAWQDNRNIKTDIYFNYTSNYGQTWLANDVRIDLGSGAGTASSSPPKVYASGNYVYVGWVDYRFNIYKGQVFLNYSVNGGQSWQATDVQISDEGDGGDVYTWKFTVNGNKIYCIWENGLDVLFDRSLNNGADWLDTDHQVNVSESGSSHDFRNPDIAVEGSTIYVFWDDYSAYKINYNHSEDGGLTWDATDRVLNNYYFPQVGISNGLVHLSYKQGDLLYYRRYNPVLDVWTDAVGVRGYDAKNYEVPAMAVSSGLVFFTWQDEVCLDRSVRYNYSLNGGNGFSFASDTHMFLNDNACSDANVSDPEIAVCGNTVYVVWVDWAKVYFTRGDIRRVLPFLNLLLD